ADRWLCVRDSGLRQLERDGPEGHGPAERGEHRFAAAPRHVRQCGPPAARRAPASIHSFQPRPGLEWHRSAADRWYQLLDSAARLTLRGEKLAGNRQRLSAV